MKQFRTMIVIAGILVAGIAFNSMSQPVSTNGRNTKEWKECKHKNKKVKAKFPKMKMKSMIEPHDHRKFFKSSTSSE